MQFMKIAIEFTRGNWCQDTEKMTVHHSCAAFLAERSGQSGRAAGPHVIAVSTAAESGSNMKGCVMCPQVWAGKQKGNSRGAYFALAQRWPRAHFRGGIRHRCLRTNLSWVRFQTLIWFNNCPLMVVCVWWVSAIIFLPTCLCYLFSYFLKLRTLE